MKNYVVIQYCFVLSFCVLCLMLTKLGFFLFSVEILCVVNFYLCSLQLPCSTAVCSDGSIKLWSSVLFFCCCYFCTLCLFLRFLFAFCVLPCLLCFYFMFCATFCALSCAVMAQSSCDQMLCSLFLFVFLFFVLCCFLCTILRGDGSIKL